MYVTDVKYTTTEAYILRSKRRIYVQGVQCTSETLNVRMNRQLVLSSFMYVSDVGQCTFQS